MLGEARATELLEAALRQSEAEQTEAVLIADSSRLTRFAGSVIHQNMAEEEARLTLRAVFGKRIGIATTNVLDPSGVKEVVRRAGELARLSAENADFRSLPGPAPVARVNGHAEATAASTPEQRAEAAATIAAEAKKAGAEASGSLSASEGELAVANSLGVRCYYPWTQGSLVVIVGDDEASGYGDWQGLDLAKLSAVEVASRAAEKCARSRGASKVEPGEYEVILEEPAAADMIQGLSYMGFGATAFQEGRSFMSGKLGERVLGENISFWDDGHDERGIPLPFDYEGVPKQKVMLIENGVARGPVYDSLTAGKEGRSSTGHALPAGHTFGPAPLNLFMNEGEASPEQMIASTRRGILVTRFHYTNVIHPVETTFTGMTRDGTFLIEDGKVVGPVAKLRFTQSILAALSNVELIGKGRLTQDGFAPPLKIRRFRFSS
jgi:predicted Zn-dependent protease